MLRAKIGYCHLFERLQRILRSSRPAPFPNPILRSIPISAGIWIHLGEKEHGRRRMFGLESVLRLHRVLLLPVASPVALVAMVA